MELAALVVACIALLLALVAMAKAGSARSGSQELERELRRQREGFANDLKLTTRNLRELIAGLAQGEKPTREMIMEGQLWRDVEPAEGVKLVAAGDLRLIDVRTPQETSGGIIPGALLIPVDQLEARLAEIPRDNRATLIYCAGGGRSAAACEFMSGQGYRNLMNLAGGFGSWNGARVKPG
jgi:rhodanese-related sulfurtransferase